jgi:hypothetical protein
MGCYLLSFLLTILLSCEFIKSNINNNIKLRDNFLLISNNPKICTAPKKKITKKEKGQQVFIKK